jgi:uncharacterized SAM-binding protein YcdF (DUF218 family)
MHLAQPFTFVFLLAGLALIGTWRSRFVSRRFLKSLTILYVLLAVICTPAVAYFAMGTLEWRYPPGNVAQDAGPVIVVLGGTVRIDDVDPQASQLSPDSLVRCIHAARLYRQGPRRTLVASGGKVSPSLPGPPLAHLMRDFLVQLGVDANDILVEDQSRTTYENAVETRKLLGQQGIEKIILVTEATHLYRAERCFRHVGFDVVPVGCNYRARPLGWSLIDFLPSSAAAANIDSVGHEWLGMAWYWFHGRI